MISVIFLIIGASCMQLGSALPDPIEGFIYLGPVPPSSNTRSTRASYYYLSRGTVNWADAITDCRRQGGILATPVNNNEDAALKFYASDKKVVEAIWIGARKISTNWIWETKNQQMGGWDNFFESDEGCYSSNGCLLAENNCSGVWGWCSATCENLNRYVCEFP